MQCQRGNSHVIYSQWRGGGERAGGAVAPPPSDNFLGVLKFKGALKSVIANVKYYTKYVKSSLSTNSKIVVILAFLELFDAAIAFGNKSIQLPFLGTQKPKMSMSC